MAVFLFVTGQNLTCKSRFVEASGSSRYYLEDEGISLINSRFGFEFHQIRTFQ